MKARTVSRGRITSLTETSVNYESSSIRQDVEWVIKSKILGATYRVNGAGKQLCANKTSLIRCQRGSTMRHSNTSFLSACSLTLKRISGLYRPLTILHIYIHMFDPWALKPLNSSHSLSFNNFLVSQRQNSRIKNFPQNIFSIFEDLRPELLHCFLKQLIIRNGWVFSFFLFWLHFVSLKIFIWAELSLEL